MSRDALEFHAPRPQYCLDLLGASFTIGHQFSGKLIDVFPMLPDQVFRLRMQEIADGLPLVGSVGEFPQQQYATLKIIFCGRHIQGFTIEPAFRNRPRECDSDALFAVLARGRRESVIPELISPRHINSLSS